jgi:aerobic C4-dicarboxylate transport protein
VLNSISIGFFKLVAILMRAAPIGAFGAFAFLIASQGVSAIFDLVKLIAAVYLTSIVFILVVLGAVGAWAGFNIFKLLHYLKEELFLVLGTSSSESALPALMEKLERAGCARPVVGLVVPTGYSFNLDGTNIYMTMAALFIAQATNTPLSIEDQIVLLLVAMLSSKGAAGVTGAGFITLAATLAVLPSIPVAGMAIILGVDRFLSECRALTNFIGNAVATIVVSRWEGALDRDKLKLAMAGKAPPLAAPPIEKDSD